VSEAQLPITAAMAKHLQNRFMSLVSGAAARGCRGLASAKLALDDRLFKASWYDRPHSAGFGPL
jgi:hypothetical protein